ncbi:PI-PLC X domain-containing protein 1 isoform X2 [Chelonoidis abingdonii]|uniref:PI-PLC X domain-containing protein 1 isoform X2 n=1 Tax=Chelonoidis abingdonii TaxID=106734 RepID=UPI0013F26C36|nr:PI-PLC X domain-containing protein 1 isoform X2 [Chelonoidis abingdonii]
MEATSKKSSHLCHENGDWMSHLPENLWDVPLHNLSLPGSHDAMTYCLDKNSDVSVNESKLLQVTDKCMPCIVHPIIMKWSITQDILWEILKWLQAHPQEVVILACRNFDGLTKELHNHLISCIKNIFHSKLCPKDVVPTLRNMWTYRYQVIISYEDVTEVMNHHELWPAIPYWWGNKTAARDLIQYLERMKKNGRPDCFFVAGINLTSDLEYILAHPFGSLKKMALSSLPYLKLWIKKQYPGPKRECINIIAGDFIGNYDFVNDVIELNKKIIPPLHYHGNETELKDVS